MTTWQSLYWPNLIGGKFKHGRRIYYIWLSTDCRKGRVARLYSNRMWSYGMCAHTDNWRHISWHHISIVSRCLNFACLRIACPLPCFRGLICPWYYLGYALGIRIITADLFTLYILWHCSHDLAYQALSRFSPCSIGTWKGHGDEATYTFNCVTI